MAVKVSKAKGAAAKKPSAKKPVAKKPAAKAAAKKPAKKPAAKKPAPAPAARRPEPEPKKPAPNRVPPRIIRKPPVISKQTLPPVPEIDTAKAVAFAMSIAEEMKRAAAAASSEKVSEEGSIKLAKRPTTRARGQETEKFPDSDLRDFRRRLLIEREKAMSGVNAMKATGFNESDDHEADGGDGTNQTLRLQALGQMGTINRTIQQIEEALHRIDDGTYGVCTVCGQLIRKPRLVNQPFVQTCMECQNEMERSRRQ